MEDKNSEADSATRSRTWQPAKISAATCEPAPELECNHEEGNTLIMVLQVLGMLEAGVSSTLMTLMSLSYCLLKTKTLESATWKEKKREDQNRPLSRFWIPDVSTL